MRMHVGLAAMVAIGFAGCGQQGPALAEVEGTLTLRGKPFPGVLICFLPDAEGGSLGPRSTAITDESGHYDLMCDQPHKPGALIGKHSVIVFDEEFWKKDGKLPYDRKYTLAALTPLHAEIGPKGRQAIDFNID